MNVALQRRVVLAMIGRVVAHEIDHARMRALGVVEVGKTVAHARPEMKQGRGRLARHAGIAISRTGANTLEEPQDRSHAADAVKARNQMHFRGPRIAETGLNTEIDQFTQHGFADIHRFQPLLIDFGGR